MCGTREDRYLSRTDASMVYIFIYIHMNIHVHNREVCVIHNREVCVYLRYERE